MNRHIRSIPKRFYFYGIAVVLIAFLFFWDGPPPSMIELHGSPSEMGKQLGSEKKLYIKMLARVYIRGFICGNDSGISAQRRTKAMELWDYILPAYQEEIASLSSSTGVDKSWIMLGNSFIDLGFSAHGCRSVVRELPDKTLLHAHNLDWDSLGGLANWSICVVRRRPSDGRLSSVSIALPGMVGALDIVNEKGICLSLNQVSFGRGEKREPIFFTMRRIAETCSTFAAAREEILACPPDMPFILTLTSFTEKTAAVFEPFNSRIVERRLQNSALAADNVTWGDETSASGPITTACSVPVRNTEELKQALRHKAVMLPCNIYSVIFDYNRNRFLLASGQTPAAEQAYREFALFPETGDRCK